jgi:4-hydroxythreonine-4-phosphate dehydrogenase
MRHIRVGITHGDINGIGYEVIMKALNDNRVTEKITVIVYGSPKAAAFHRKVIDLQNFSFNLIQTAQEANPKRSNIIDCCDPELKVEPGISTIDAGKAAFQALKAAVADLRNNTIDVVVTAPINKKNINEAGFEFPGHTEFFASQFNSPNHVMLLMNDVMKVGVVAGHIPVSQISSFITKEKIVQKLEVLNSSMISDFGIRKPRIAVLGLNPHAGDEGLLGNEEQTVIIPAIQEARNKGIMALGPYAADGFFGSGEFSKFDVILGMYHDQALAPFKALAFDNAVNVTLGLPIVRVSPAHGTAYSLVGQNQASELSMIQAIFTACDIYESRVNYRELVANKLTQ